MSYKSFSGMHIQEGYKAFEYICIHKSLLFIL